MYPIYIIDFPWSLIFKLTNIIWIPEKLNNKQEREEELTKSSQYRQYKLSDKEIQITSLYDLKTFYYIY